MRYLIVAVIVILAVGLPGGQPVLAEECPAPPPVERVSEPVLTLQLDFTERTVGEGERLSVAGQAFWPNGRPVYGLSPDNRARFAAGEPVVDDCRFEGGIVTLGLHLPLGPDGVARAIDVVGWTVVDARGRFELAVAVPWALYPGETDVWAKGLITVTACDRPAQQRGEFACSFTPTPFDVVIVPAGGVETIGSGDG